MPASYVSARFEKTNLYAEIGKQRCILRNKDDGPYPPPPSPTYFPTDPNTLRNFILVEYVDDVVGERIVRIATISDIGGASSQLRDLEDTSVDFIAAGVTPGDQVQFYLPQNAEWVSEEFPDALLRWTIVAALSPTKLRVVGEFPSFKSGLSWAIAARSLSSVNGVTRRTLDPAPLDQFLDKRFNALFSNVPARDAFVEATKASLDALGVSSTAGNDPSENYTSKAP